MWHIYQIGGEILTEAWNEQEGYNDTKKKQTIPFNIINYRNNLFNWSIKMDSLLFLCDKVEAG